MRSILPAAVLLVVLAVPGTAQGQQTCLPTPGIPTGHECTHVPAPSRTEGQLLTFAANVLTGGLTAGVKQALNGGSFRDGFWRGSVGGAGTYLGKRIAVGSRSGAGFFGRGVAAVGASITRNAADGLPMLDRLILPVGFVRIHWQPSRHAVHTSFDLPGVIAIAGIYASSLGAEIDWGRTFDSGMPIFMARNWDTGRGWLGRHIAGAVVMRGDAIFSFADERLVARIDRHERLHALQYDQSYILWSEPVDKRLLAWVGTPDPWARTVDLSIVGLVTPALVSRLPHAFEVWETEAQFLARTRNGDLTF